ncbi:MAG: hypothetical protein J0L70_22830 [Leptolyngbya sp. UWPOB_LEPTO1]|uniref:hypothetical protein n=1 Tax=Leptolyngbya sp. UWPOB_LEPTO1 TaxID=2815653 RepID=UPI001ACC11AA|nr:hypothetical protein [Leptolyngbya sp. UWPOB_LEPTO1]MBN8563374.1 hypothetical protein [Leptolyngbya sp. UWPOB_LEPTO1]
MTTSLEVKSPLSEAVSLSTSQYGCGHSAPDFEDPVASGSKSSLLQSRATAFIWRNDALDETGAWGIQGTTFQIGAAFRNMPPLGSNSDWKLVDAGGFTGGENTLLWRNAVTDQTAIWTVDGIDFEDGFLLTGAPSLGSNSPWRLVGGVTISDSPTLVWRNQVTDQTAIWKFNETGVFQSGAFLENAPGLGANSAWQLIDALGNGNQLELLWRNQTTDETAIWKFDGSNFSSSAFVANLPQLGSNSPWELAKFVDVDGNKSADLIWQNRTSGEQAVWFLNGSDFTSSEFIKNAPRPDANWQIVGVVSIDLEELPTVIPQSAASTQAPSTNTLVWANDSDDTSGTWDIESNPLGATFINGRGIEGAPAIPPNSPWTLIDAIAKPGGGIQYLWRNQVTDETGVWTIQNNQFVSSAFLGGAPKLGSNSSWELISHVFLGDCDQTTLVWRNQATDETALWTFDANYQFVGSEFVSGAPVLGSNSQWKLIDAVDSYGYLDLLWRNEVIDETGFWILDGKDFSYSGMVENAPKLGSNSPWKLVKTENLNDDGHADLIWQNFETGEQGIWYLDDLDFASGVVVNNAPRPAQNWRVVGAV